MIGSDCMQRTVYIAKPCDWLLNVGILCRLHLAFDSIESSWNRNRYKVVQKEMRPGISKHKYDDMQKHVPVDERYTRSQNLCSYIRLETAMFTSNLNTNSSYELTSRGQGIRSYCYYVCSLLSCSKVRFSQLAKYSQQKQRGYSTNSTLDRSHAMKTWETYLRD